MTYGGVGPKRHPSSALHSIILVHGLQGDPYKTWRSDPAKHDHDQLLDPSRTGRALHRLLRWRSRSKSQETGKQVLRDTTVEPESHTEEGPRIQIDDEKPFQKKDIYWPLDLLAEKCPQARICVYGYDTLVAGYQRVNKDSLYQIAKNFFNELPSHGAGNLPTVFIAHSLGGLVVKEALIMSSQSRLPISKNIVSTTAAVVFMGTPHRGSKQWASKGDKGRKIASALFADNNPALLDTLGLKNGELFRSLDNFTQLWEESGFIVKTYMEDRSYIGGEKIVPDESSLLGNLKEQAISLTGDHSRICKFNGKNDTNWSKVGPQLEKYYEEAIASGKPKEHASKAKDQLQGFLEVASNADLANTGYGIDPPSDGTCEWIFDDPIFSSWIDDPKQLALLCIHGSLGSGKSTLMKHVVASLQRSPHARKNNVAAFFCGASKENTSDTTPAEIYRSLLLQILRNASLQENASEIVENIHTARLLLKQEEHAHHKHLCKVLKDLFRDPQRTQTVVLIDAINKCTDPDELIEFFQDIASTAPATKIKICFTCQRTFPIVDSQCRHIAIEDFNHGDIASYVEKRLPVTDIFSQEDRADLQQSIKDKASGIFLWVTLVVKPLRRHLHEGRDLSFLHRLLDETPSELTKLYRNIIASSLEAHTMVRVMQWVLLSARPLTLNEWHHVFAFIDNPCLKSIDEWKNSSTYTETDSLLLQRIKHVSCGLVDVKDRQVPSRPTDTHSMAGSLGADAGSFESYQYINVIHDSIRSFFLDGGGFALLDPELKEPIGEGHAYILEVCIRYSFLEEMKEAFKIEPQRRRRREPHEEKTEAFKIRHREEFNNVHEEDDEADETMSLGSSAGASIRSSHSKDFDRRSRSMSRGSIRSTSTKELLLRESDHAENGVSDYLDRLEITSIHTTANSTYDSIFEHTKVVDPPSLWQYCHDMVVYHAVGAEKAYTTPEKALDFLLSQDLTVWAATRKDMRDGATLHYFAAQWNLVSWLLYFGLLGLEVVPGGPLQHPVIVAANNDNLKAFEYLVKQDYSKQYLAKTDHQGRTALHHAAMFPDSSVLSRILEPDEFESDFLRVYTLNMAHGNHPTPLHLAAFFASSRNVEELISAGADLNCIDRSDCTPLHLACLRKEPDLRICKALVDAGCNYRLRDCNSRTAFDLAAENRHFEIVEYLAALSRSRRNRMKRIE
ncbi:hypothetical protein BDV95DRAFT_589453 [Massariosphaeria phaeospora]|uniref:Nephrocystin 3-like N-terminal domain-containing protein n=1 Tax=Massariosphaeria phaeospora TaxID=100035 RepID=A0A7C8IKD3_9PLEO|nr:hypothetical protein BDV95DRAFT_589453 [Massariosphaeria phaeospora]